MRSRPRYRVIQRHHIQYNPEITALVFQSEHHILTQLDHLAKCIPSGIFLHLIAEWMQNMDCGKFYDEEAMGQIQVENRKKQLAAQKRRRKRKK